MKHRNMFSLLLVAILTACTTRSSPPQEGSAGGEKAGKTEVLEAGAKLLQSRPPLGQLDVYLVGFHPMKDNPSVQMEAHHYCHQVNEDFAQCVLFDGNTKDAQMNGVEYIVSEKMFNSLPPDEKKYWHPHNFEILSGELIAPGLPDAAEHSLMAQKMNSYGKTWHFWMTDSHGKAVDKLPLGVPHLAWSFNHDGEIDTAMVSSRDERLTVRTEEKRKQRSDLSQYAHPQTGVNAIRKSFPKSDGAPPGVQDISEAH